MAPVIKQVGVAEPDGERQPREQVADPDAGAAGVARLDVLVAARIVELGLGGPDDGVVRRARPEVDLRAGDLGLAARRDVLEQQLRAPLLGDGRDQRHRDAVAVGELQPLVHPGLRLRREPLAPFSSRTATIICR